MHVIRSQPTNPTGRPMPEPTDLVKRIAGLLADIEAGQVRIVPREDPDHVFAGNVTYDTDNGWVIVVFNDCNDWDYLDSATDPDGQALDFVDMPDSLQDYRPPDDVVVSAYQFPSDDVLAERRARRGG